MQILGGPVYMHQFKINAKAAFNGDVWQWHQDYGTWARDDLMPEARAMNVALFLEDVTEFNGALMFIPRSHKAGTLEAGHDLQTTSYPLWTIDNATITRLVAEGGLVAPKGPAGSMILFHGNLVHGSPLRPGRTWSSRSPATRRRRSAMRAGLRAGLARRQWSTSRPMRLPGRCSRERARKAGVVYSMAYGDQPALVCEMVDWAEACGFEVVAAGKGTKHLPEYHRLDAGYGVDTTESRRRTRRRPA
jgi:hypothetical protein